MSQPPQALDERMTLAQAFDRAVQLHRQGKLTEAERLYTAVLKARPDSIDTLHLLGVLKHARGQSPQVLQLISAALEASEKIGRPMADALSNYGLVLASLNRHSEALAAYDRALAIAPEMAETLNNRGNALHKLNLHVEALATFERALAIKPDFASAQFNRGNALHKLNRREEARASYDIALAIKPSRIPSFLNPPKSQ